MSVRGGPVRWDYRRDQEQPSWVAFWYERDNNNDLQLVPLLGVTVTAEVVDSNGFLLKSVPEGVCIGANTGPNITINWPTGFFESSEFDTHEEEELRLHVKAASGSGDRFYRPGNEDVLVLHPLPQVQGP